MKMPNSQRVYGCILQVHRQILLVRGRSSGKWSFPKGHAYPSESAIICAHRETYEETGYRLDPESTYTKVQLAKGTYFHYRLPSKFPACPIDRQEVFYGRWFDIEDIPDSACNVDVNSFYRMYFQTNELRTQRNRAFVPARILPGCVPYDLL
jgi:8-oxo-dGTP pyrophosphatase MutT (NUDIX family)